MDTGVREHTLTHIRRHHHVLLNLTSSLLCCASCVFLCLCAHDQLPSSDPHYKYRKSFQTQPGLRFIHPGLIDNNNNTQQQNIRHGVITKQQTESAASLLSSPTASLVPSPLSSYLSQQQESVYASNVIAPVGRSYARGHQLPEKTKQGDFRFGLTSKCSNDNAKDIIYQATPASTSAAATTDGVDSSTDNYSDHRRQTMHSLPRAAEAEVTQPVHRDYNWSSAKISPDTFTFGLPMKEIDQTGNNVRKALQPEWEEKESLIVSQRVIQHQRDHQHRIGETRPIQDPKLQTLTQDPEFRFGTTSSRDEWGAKQSIRGEYTPQQLQPDKDLGRSRHAWKRSLTTDQMSPSGLPSIRTDRPIPAQKSVASTMNYGNEGNSRSLIYPAASANQGIHPEHFTQSRSATEIRAIFGKMNVIFKDRVFDRVCQYAEALYGVLSLDSVRNAYNRIKEEKQCLVCGARQCQHPECVDRPCCHDGEQGLGNHSKRMTHERILYPIQKPATVTGKLMQPVDSSK